MHDVLIVGGGPAGAVTAVHLARAGHGVTLLERATSYERKACGEGLFPRGVAELRDLGLLEQVRRHSASLAGVRFHAGTHSVAAEFPSGLAGIGVQRRHLDPLALDLAREAGVEVRTGVTVRTLALDGDQVAGVRTDEGELAARVIVAADGLGSRMRRQAGLDRSGKPARYGVSAHLRASEDPGPLVDVYFEDGYELYVTPVDERVINVAVLLRRSAMRRFAGNLTEAYEALLRQHSAFGPEIEILDRPLPAGPFSAACSSVWRRNLVLVGDAAGFYDAITGEGMSSALVSARECASAVGGYLAAGDEAPFRRYDARRGALVRNSNLLARVSLALGSRPRLSRLAVRNLARRPRTFARLLAISSGECGMRALRPSDVSALAFGF